MESSGLSTNASEPPSHRWSRIIGTTIALLTLIIPTLAIAYYSSPVSVESLPRRMSHRPASIHPDTVPNLP
ncbi:MAG: hypothetical protein F6K03_10070 [Kamptonema sp. SIO4C4]|nr:hypothetical protein [Kamptonema sp. SIO4C4]